MKVNNISPYQKNRNFNGVILKGTDRLSDDVAKWLKSSLLSNNEKAELIFNFRILNKLTNNHDVYGTLGNHNKPANIVFEAKNATVKNAILAQGSSITKNINTDSFVKRDFPYTPKNGCGRFPCYEICNPVKFLKEAINMIPLLNKNATSANKEISDIMNDLYS